MIQSSASRPDSVGRYLDPYIIAEIGVNHEGSMKRALEMIDQVARAGGHAAKFQTYKANKLAAKDSPSYWDLRKEPTTSQRELFAKYDRFEREDYVRLAAHCDSRGVDFLSTPFDVDAVGMLNPLVRLFKIASADILNVPLLRAVAATGKPVVLSTGAATYPEIEFALNTLRAAGARIVTVLHCVLNYPTPDENANLAGITKLQHVFSQYPVGYSDHVVPDETMTACEVATLMGAVVIEKHFTDDKSLPGNDHYHAMDESDLARFVTRLSQIRTLSGSGERDMSLEAAARSNARRSIVAAADIKAGETLSERNLTTKRPGTGISSMHWDDIIGRSSVRDISEDEILSWSDLD